MRPRRAAITTTATTTATIHHGKGVDDPEVQVLYWQLLWAATAPMVGAKPAATTVPSIPAPNRMGTRRRPP
jgi:hypothetical protein